MQCDSKTQGYEGCSQINEQKGLALGPDLFRYSMIKKGRCVIFTIIALIIIFSCAPKAYAQDDLARQFRILFISSYSYSNAAVPDQLEGFKKGMEGINADITYEFMDSDKYYGAIDIQNFDKYVKYKVFSARNYDLVAVADDSALRYAINNRSVMFPDLPMVFMGINNKTEAVTAAAMKNATGIAESPDFEGNYALMKALFPNRDHLVVVVDSSVAGQGDYVEFMKFSENHPELKYNIVNTSYYTANGLKEVFHELGAKDIILFLDFSTDGQKQNYSLQNASDFIRDNSRNIPIFRLASANVEHGVLGGISYSYYEAGRIAGETAKRILNGESADSIPLQTNTLTSTYFEQGALDRFGIKYSELPPNSVILNEHWHFTKFYRDNRVISNLMIVILILLVAMITILYNTSHRRKKMLRTDFLTKMPNRMKIIEDMNQAISQSESYGIIMLDVDHFKDINDTYGHNVGDEVIVGVGQRLQKLADKNLTFARLGGDEFCGLFKNPGRDRAKEICQEILSSAKEPFDTSKGKLRLTLSIGCAMYPLDTKDSGTVLECADKALYVTKGKGRNGYTLFNSVN